jgi:hypothetical protein
MRIFLKHGLLYWDEIEFVSPFQGYDVLPRYPETVIRELAKFTKPYVPTKEEKQRAHDQIMKLVDGDLPVWLRIGEADDNEDTRLYSMFSHKLLHETWHELKKRKLVRMAPSHGGHDHVSHNYLGLTMMAILARSCAGTHKHTITDQNDSHFTLLKHLQFLSGETEAGRNAIDRRAQKTYKRWLDTLGVSKGQAEDKARETLVWITLDVIEAKTLSVCDLLKLRNDKTKFAAELRQNYAATLDKYLASLNDPAITATDSTALLDDFRRATQQDLDRLYNELKLNALEDAAFQGGRRGDGRACRRQHRPDRFRSRISTRRSPRHRGARQGGRGLPHIAECGVSGAPDGFPLFGERHQALLTRPRPVRDQLVAWHCHQSCNRSMLRAGN